MRFVSLVSVVSLVALVSVVALCSLVHHRVVFLLKMLDLHPLGGLRATIKAHPTTPHHPRPYGKGSSPGKMESQNASLVDKDTPRGIYCTHSIYPWGYRDAGALERNSSSDRQHGSPSDTHNSSEEDQSSMEGTET